MRQPTGRVPTKPVSRGPFRFVHFCYETTRSANDCRGVLSYLFLAFMYPRHFQRSGLRRFLLAPSISSVFSESSRLQWPALISSTVPAAASIRPVGCCFQPARNAAGFASASRIIASSATSARASPVNSRQRDHRVADTRAPWSICSVCFCGAATLTAGLGLFWPKRERRLRFSPVW
jgi:hypothetical protein